MAAGESYAERDGRHADTSQSSRLRTRRRRRACAIRWAFRHGVFRLASCGHRGRGAAAQPAGSHRRCYAECDGLVASPLRERLGGDDVRKSASSVSHASISAPARRPSRSSQTAVSPVEVIPVGGQQSDLRHRKALQTPLAEAERIKTLYGTLLNAQSDEHESISYPVAGEEDEASYETTKARLTDIIRPRVQQTNRDSCASVWRSMRRAAMRETRSF